MKVTAVFQCTEKVPQGQGFKLAFMPPYCVDRTPGAPYDAATASERYRRVNEEWAPATPSGSLSMQVDNPAASAQFEQGEFYLLTFERFER